MANKSFVITISSPRSVADLQQYITSTTNPRIQCGLLSQWLKKIQDGLEPGVTSFTVQTSASPPVRATGTYTLSYGDIANNDTVTIGGTVLTCVTGTPSGPQFKKQNDGTVTAANMAAAVNAEATISKLFYATSSGVVVTLQALTPGVIGNKLTIATSNGTGFVVSAATLASGTGGDETAPLTYTRG